MLNLYKQSLYMHIFLYNKLSYRIEGLLAHKNWDLQSGHSLLLLFVNHFMIQLLWNFFLQVLQAFLGSCPVGFTTSKQIAHSYTPANFLSMFYFHNRIPLMIVLFLLCSWDCSIKAHRLPSSILRPSPNYIVMGLN